MSTALRSPDRQPRPQQGSRSRSSIRAWVPWLVGCAGVALALVVTLIVGILLERAPAPTAAVTSSAPATFTVSGQVRLPATLWDFALVDGHEGCRARAGTVPDQNGVQALVNDGVTPRLSVPLGDGQLVGTVSAFTSGTCVIPFTIADLPTSAGRWQITVGTDIKFAPTDGSQLILQPTGAV